MKLYLIDAYAIIYRSYYALIRAPRINSKGLNTSAIMGFCNTLNEVLQKMSPTHIAVAFDHGKTFRHEIFPAYKAQREETPEDIRLSVPLIKQILAAYRIPSLQVDGFEADDVIGTVAAMGEADGMEVFMLTPDKDYAQLVTEKIHILRPRHGGGYEDMGPKEVCEKYGLENTSQVIDLLGLMGDSSDNYQGCPGVGEKTAAKLIQQFGSIEGLLARTPEIKGKMREKVEGAVDDIILSKKLATIRTDVPMTTTLDEMMLHEPDKDELRKIFDELEFKTFAEKLLGTTDGSSGQKSSKTKKSSEKQNSVNLQLSFFDEFPTDGQEVFKFSTPEDESEASGNTKTIENVDDILHFLQEISTYQKIAFSAKGSSESGVDATLTGMSVAVTEGTSSYFDLSPTLPHRDKIIMQLQKIFSDEKKVWVTQNAKYALQLLWKDSITVEGRLWDTMVAHYLINPDLHHNKQYLEEPFRKEKALSLLKIQPELEALLIEAKMKPLFEQVEMPLVPVLAEMELTGVLLDTAELQRVNDELSSRLANIEREVYELAGEAFNIASPKQVAEILYVKLKITDKTKKTKTKQLSTAEEVLQQLRSRHPIVGKILDWRGLKKLIGTYVEALPKLINPRTGHIHTTFNQCVTATGRLSSSDPNLQNIPVRTAEGREIRRCFIPEPGELFFSCDYSQVELRIMASLARDHNMIEAFLSGQDIHAATAAKIYHKQIEEVSKDERRKAKSANFGIIYGISAFGLAQGLDIDRHEAKELIDGYFESFPQVMAYIDRVKMLAQQNGYAVTLMGRRRYLPDINSHNGTVRAFAERNAVNAPIQGTAADIMKVAMVRVYRRMKAEGLKAKLILQVHDELNFTCPADEKERLQRLVTEEMQRAAELTVPLLADGGWGNNWLEAH